MAYELVEEVLDHAPADLGATDVLLLTAIAEEARKGSRTAEIPAERLARRCRLSESGLRKAFQRLEKLKINVRVPMGTDRKGRPIYAVPGRVCAFVLPTFTPPENCPCHRCEKAVSASLLQTKEGPQGLPPGLEGLQGGTTGSAAGTGVPPNQTGDPYGVSPVHAVPPPRAPSGRDDVTAAKQWAREQAGNASRKHRTRTRPHTGAYTRLLEAVPPPEAEAA